MVTSKGVAAVLQKLKAWWNKMLGPKVEDTEQPQVTVDPPHPTPGLGPPPPRKQADEE
jgi:hypothetical protein